MRVFFLGSTLLLIAALSAHAQGGVITLASDAAGTNCSLADKTGGICSYYVVHIEAPGVTACSFSAPVPSCLSATWLSDTAVYPVTLGGSQNGVSIGYGSCLRSPVHVLTINFFCQGLSVECCEYRIVPNPMASSGQVEAVDCAEHLIYAAGGRAVVNATNGCPCGYNAEESTWGKVKTLYGD